MPVRPAPIDAAASPDAITDLILLIFKVNGRLLLAGDELVGPLGLTSARWQVLGSIAAAEGPQPVVALARHMGVTRQGVQRIVNELARERLVTFGQNPQHKRAKLVILTPEGRELFERALARQQPWALALARGLTGRQIRAARDALNILLDRVTSCRTPPTEAPSTP